MTAGGGIRAVCARCGACLPVCPVYRQTLKERFAPRGKHVLLAAAADGLSSAGLTESISACLQCGACSAACSAGVAVDREILASRADNPEFVQSWPLLWKTFSSEVAWSVSKALSRVPAATGVIYRLAALICSRKLNDSTVSAPVFPLPSSEPLFSSKGLKKFHAAATRGRGGRRQFSDTALSGKRIAVFAGCVQTFIYPEIVNSMSSWFPDADFVLPEQQCCCGLPAVSAGAAAPARKLVERNIRVLSEVEAEYIMTGCASCSFMMRRWPEMVEHDSDLHEKAVAICSRLYEFTELVSHLEPVVRNFDFHGGVAFHAPCHSRFSQGGISSAEAFLEKTCGDRFVSMEQGCCGHGGSFSLHHADISMAIFQERLNALNRTGAETVVTTCSGCLMQWRALAGGKIRVLHAAEIQPFT